MTRGHPAVFGQRYLFNEIPETAPLFRRLHHEENALGVPAHPETAVSGEIHGPGPVCPGRFQDPRKHSYILATIPDATNPRCLENQLAVFDHNPRQTYRGFKVSGDSNLIAVASQAAAYPEGLKP